MFYFCPFRALIISTKLPLPKPPSFSMKPSSGTTTFRFVQGKSQKPYSKGIELDFYPDFVCRKPKLNWNLTKFDSAQQIVELNSSIAIARNTRTSGLPLRGKLTLLTTNKHW